MEGHPEDSPLKDRGHNRNNNSTPVSLETFLPELLKANHCYVAYSGGVDSHVLLHLVARNLPAERITALHVNHQLSPNADQWAKHCQATSEALGVVCRVCKVDVQGDGSGIEAAARHARYRVFDRQVRQGDLLLMAHHGDDQVETMLYRLMRGSGAGGVAGMPVTRAVGEGKLIRPLLGFSRKAIEGYARIHNLVWIEDESNQALHFDRNYLRHNVIPQLVARWPDYLQRLSHTARLLDQAQMLNDDLAAMDLAEVNETRERLGFSIDITALSALTTERQNNLLRFWLKKLKSPVPGDRVLTEIREQVLTAAVDAQPKVEHSGATFCRYQQKLYLIPSLPELTAQSGSRPLLPGQTVTLADGSQLSTSVTKGVGLRCGATDKLEIGFRQGGERCHPAGRSGSNTLKKLLQEYRLEPWLRDRVPLIYLNGQLAAVGDLWVCESFLAKPGEQSLALHWCYP